MYSNSAEYKCIIVDVADFDKCVVSDNWRDTGIIGNGSVI